MLSTSNDTLIHHFLLQVHNCPK